MYNFPLVFSEGISCLLKPILEVVPDYIVLSDQETIPTHSGDVCSMQRVSTVDTMGAIWGSTAMLHVLLERSKLFATYFELWGLFATGFWWQHSIAL